MPARQPKDIYCLTTVAPFLYGAGTPAIWGFFNSKEMDTWAEYLEAVYYWVEAFKNECNKIGFNHGLDDYSIETSIMKSIWDNPKEIAENLKNQTK